MNEEQELELLEAIVEAEMEHLTKHILKGERTLGHKALDNIIDSKRRIEDLRQIISNR